MIFYILFFLLVCVNASFDQTIKTIMDKPWHLSTLIKKGQVAALLQQDGSFDCQSDPFDYKVFDNQLCVVKRHAGSFSFSYFSQLEKLPNQILVPELAEKIFLTSKDEFVYKNGCYLNVVGKEYAGIINIPYYSDYDFQTGFLLKNCLYVLDDCGYVRCLGLRSGTYEKFGWPYFFLKENQIIKSPNFFEEKNIRFFFEEGRWVRTRGVNLSISADKKHLYLQTFDNRIVSAAPFGPMGSPWSACYYQYPCELIKNENITNHNLIVNDPVYKTTGGLKYDLLFGSPKNFISDFYEFFIRLTKRSLRQSALWITFCGISLCLAKSRLIKSFSLLMTAGALLISNRKFLLDFINDFLHKPRGRPINYNPIQEIHN